MHKKDYFIKEIVQNELISKKYIEICKKSLIQKLY